MRHHTISTARSLGAMLLVGSLLVGAGSALAQETPSATEAMNLTNAPVDMHEGTCANPTLDPWAELGRLQRQGVDNTDDEGLLDNIGLGDDEEGFLTEDDDGDGVLDDGEDDNDNGILDVGTDDNGDGVLDEDEVLVVDEAAEAGARQPVTYTMEGEISSGYGPLFDQQNIIAIHQSSEEYENIVACGNLGGVDYEDEDEIAIGLRAMDGSGIRGYAVFEFDPAVFGDDVTAVTVYAFEGLGTQRDNSAAATP